MMYINPALISAVILKVVWGWIKGAICKAKLLRGERRSYTESLRNNAASSSPLKWEVGAWNSVIYNFRTVSRLGRCLYVDDVKLIRVESGTPWSGWSGYPYSLFCHPATNEVTVLELNSATPHDNCTRRTKYSNLFSSPEVQNIWAPNEFFSICCFISVCECRLFQWGSVWYFMFSIKFSVFTVFYGLSGFLFWYGRHVLTLSELPYLLLRV